jgi:kynurenine formamidase
MTTLIDLTVPINHYPGGNTVQITDRKISASAVGCGGTYNCHRIQMEAGTGTHISFPSHLDEANSTLCSHTFNAQDFWQVPTTVLHTSLNRSKKITANVLSVALGNRTMHPHLIVHAMTEENQTAHPASPDNPRMTPCAVQWLLDQPFRVLICDALEAAEPQKKTGVCMQLYLAQRCIVFAAYDLHRLPEECTTTIIPLGIDGLTQTPCRLLAHI